MHYSETEVPRPDFAGGPGNWVLRNLTQFTILFGKNGSGKSVLLRHWRDLDPENFHYISPERVGQMVFQAGLMAELQTGQQRRERSQQNQSLDYRQSVITRIGTFLSARGAIDDPVDMVKPSEIAARLSEFIPDFAIKITGRSPYSELTRESTGAIIGDVNQLSSGEAQILSLGIDILLTVATWHAEGREKNLLLIDEPDAHVHPDLQVRFAEFIVKLAKDFSIQIVFATHSTTTLSAIGRTAPDDTSIVYMEFAKSEFSAKSFSKVLMTLTACLGGHLLMGPLMGSPLLLVEGDDDSRIWSQVPRHHVVDFAVIPCGGDEIKEYQKTLEQIFSSLLDAAESPIGFALLDGDKNPPVPDSDNPQNFIRFLQLNCHEAENLYLTDEVLTDLDLTWDQAKDLIKYKAWEFGQKEPLLASVDDWDRQNHDLKVVINEVANILDDKNVPWTVRVGKRIGTERPTEQLPEFLGNELIDALWGPEPALEEEQGEGNDET